MSIYSELLERVEKGAKFKINLVEKTLKIDGKEIALKGCMIDNNDLTQIGIKPSSPMENIEQLYANFKRSVPSAKYNGKSYFKADSVEDLTDSEIAFNWDRSYAQAALEGYVLLGGLIWGNDDHWFWQSKNYPECVVLREWIYERSVRYERILQRPLDKGTKESRRKI